MEGTKLLYFSDYARWNHHKSFEHRVAAPLTFWVPGIFQAWNQNLFMKHGPSDQFSSKNRKYLLVKKWRNCNFESKHSVKLIFFCLFRFYIGADYLSSLSSSATSQFFSWCHTWNELHLRGQNYRRILRWSRGWLSTFPCLRSSLGVWGKRRFLSHRHSQNFRNMNRNIESWCVVWVVEGSRVVAKGGLKSPY